MDLKTVIVLAAHGAPARDYPRWKVGALMAIEMSGERMKHLPGVSKWHTRLEAEVRDWPRTPDSDPYQAAVDELARGLEDELGLPVIAGYNEFCPPTMADALDQAANQGAERVIVIPTMLLRGNEHTEAEIADTIENAQQRHPQIEFIYAWPFEQNNLVQLYASQVRLKG